MNNERIGAISMVLAVCMAGTAAGDVTCVTPNAAIPDDSPAGVSVPIVVAADAGSVVDSITVDLDIGHAWVGDLVVTLASPSGTVVTLLDRPGIPSTGFPGPFGCGGSDVFATFADDGATPAESVCSVSATPVIAGSVIPSGSLSGFAGDDAGGTWLLTVTDASSYDAGVVRGVCLDLAVSHSCVADLAEPFGVLNFFDLSAFIGLFNAGDPAADLAGPFGTLNFFDVAEYIAQFNIGCP